MCHKRGGEDDEDDEDHENNEEYEDHKLDYSCPNKKIDCPGNMQS